MSVRVPTTVITGFLGAGKTTAILHLLRSRPPGSNWAVFVNEFGEVGIDGAALGTEREVAGLSVRELAGGCICCSSGLPFLIALTTLLREVKPQRLLIEPTGLADLETLLGTLRGPSFAAAIEPRASICLVDPRVLRDARYTEHEVFGRQLEACEVLVANRCDQASAAQLEDFDALVKRLPPKAAVFRAEHARLDPAWLDLPARERAPVEHEHAHAPRSRTEVEGEIERSPYADKRVAACGWRFGEEWRFGSAALESAIRGLLADRGLLPNGLIRFKGAVRTESGDYVINTDAGEVLWDAVAPRKDCRFEVIAPADPPPDWVEIEARLRACRLT